MTISPMPAIALTVDPWLLAAAVGLDLMVGDPPWLPHPIRLMGMAISKGEGFARRLPFSPFSQGLFLSVGVVALFAVSTFAVVAVAYSVAPWAGMAAAVITVFFGLSLRCLGDEVLGVASAMEGLGMDVARRRLSFIVGRDTSHMDEGQIAMAAIETAAENLVDGFASPLFYAVLAGPVGIMAYKAVNTLDSMIGYRNERYARFGTFAARLDDLANYIPARITLLVISFMAFLGGYGPPWAFMTRAMAEARKHASPNSGLPEAAFALLLGVRLGGPASYGGVPCERPFIAPDNPLPFCRDVRRAVRWLYLCGLCLGFLSIVASMFVFHGW